MRTRQARATGRGVPTAYLGIDVGAYELHCVAVDGELNVLDVAVFAATDLDDLIAWMGACPNAGLSPARMRVRVAIDAPAELSTAPHAEDLDLSPKFRAARCAEIALGRAYSCWVPWVTPTAADPVSGWMSTGFALYTALRAAGLDPIEVFPYAAFRELTRPDRLPKKQTTDGARARVAALERRGVDERHIETFSHHTLDALVAALIARDHAHGTARAATCGHDASAIWLPAS